MRIHAEESILLVVDIQDKLLAAIPTAETLIRNAGFLMDVAALLTIPIRATEQYPKGLGPTNAAIARRLPQPIPAKTAFSCCGAEGLLHELRALNRGQIVLVGMETHVCVSQTAFDLLEAGFHVVLPVDALASRFALDAEVALRRLERGGATVTTVEAIAFEWVRDASHPQFKNVSKLVRERSRA
jgi:nicotinamidase-related amidase